MHYRYLTEIGGSYTAPSEVGTVGHRVDFLDSIAGQLRAAQMSLAAAKEAAKPAPFVGTVRERAQAFANMEADQAAAKLRIQAAQARVDKAQRWLTRMGARVDAAGQIDWGFSHRTVAYDNTLAAQGLTRVRFHAGGLYMDDAHRQPLDTRLMVTANMGPGAAIYVMSETGNIHVSSHSVGDRHHSSLLAGANVAGAGELKVITGKLTWISNKSGHYFPETEHLLQTLHALQKNGVDLGPVKLNFLFAGGPPRGTPYASVAAFLAAKQAEGVPDFDYAKLLRYLVTIPYAQFSAMAAVNGWRWVNDPEYNAGMRGVVTIAGGVQVPHRDVRKWLKANLQVAATAVKSGAGR